MKKLSTIIKKLSTLNSQLSTPEGFTLLELIIVVAIIGIVSAIGTGGLIEYTRTAKLNSAANQLVTTLNVAKSNALSQVKDPNLCGAGDTLEGYKVAVNACTTYDLYVRCGGVDKKVMNTKSLPSSIVFTNTAPASFFFPILTGGVVGNGTVITSGYGKTRCVAVNPGGIINQPQVCPAGTPCLTPTPTPTPPPPCGTFVLKWGVSDPFFIAVDSSNNVYVNSPGGVSKFTSSGSGIGGWSTSGFKVGIAVDSNNNVYVGGIDAVNNTQIQKFTSSGGFITQWGSNGSGDGQFAATNIYGIAVDSSNNVYVADGPPNNRIQKFTSSGGFITKWGSSGSGDGQFNSPGDVAVDSSNNVYVVDSWNHRVQKFTSSGGFITKWGSFGSGDGQFSNPTGIDIDSSNSVYVVERGNSRVQKFTSSGGFITKWGSFGSGDGQFGNSNGPFGIAVDSNNYVYVADRDNIRIEKFVCQ